MSRQAIDASPANATRASWFRDELSLRRLFPTLIAAGVVGVLEIVVATSFAALIFSGPLSDEIAAGIGLTLFAGSVFLVVISLLATQPGTVGSIQDTSAAVLALMAATIATRVSAAEPQFLTVVVAIALTSVLAGGLYFLLGALRLGDLVRFVPYPVVGGFLAGTGWLLVKGGMGVLAQQSLTLSNLADFGRSPLLAKWIPGLAFAIVLVVLARRFRNFLLIPGLIVGAIALFYVVLLVSGVSVAEAEAEGWLLGPFPRGALWEPWALTGLGQADWSAIFGQAGNIATILVLGLLALLLNASGIELALDRDVDLNRELRAAGVANVVAGAGGGMLGFHALSFTALAQRTGASSRLVGPLAAILCLGALVFGASALSLFPRPVLGGLLVFLGLSFLFEWVYDAWFRLSRAEYAIVLLILLVVGTVGFLQGVAVGMVVALILFVISYSRTDLVRHTLSGTTYQSAVERSPADQDMLEALGQQIHVMELQGFVFFGTANSMLERIARRAVDDGLPPMRFLVLDFRRVTGVDSSAVLSFSKARKLADARDFSLVFTGLPPELRRRLEREGMVGEGRGLVRTFADLDHGMEWCEEQLLGSAMVTPSPEARRLFEQLQDGTGRRIDPDRLMPYLHRIEVPAGHVLIRQDAPAEELFFLESGRVTAHIEGSDEATVRLRTMGPGTVVGEMPLYLQSRRTASVTSDTPSTLHRLSMTDFRRMEREDPELAAALHRMFARLMAQRLAHTIQAIKALQD
jgi:sulfate permease, SulP family